MKRIAVIGVVLEEPDKHQEQFNEIVSEHQSIVQGRMGIPFVEENIGVVSLTVVGEMDQINEFTGKLGQIPDISVKTAVSKKEIK